MNTKQLRAAFWRDHPQFVRRYNTRANRPATQNEYPADIRVAWCDYVEAVCRNGEISARIAQNATL